MFFPKKWAVELPNDTTAKIQEVEDQVSTIENAGTIVYPPLELRYNAFKLLPDQVKVVIVGQDPYHRKGQAMGLSFSVPKDVKIPPSLRNIHKELHNDLGIAIPDHGDLTAWANQGVLLLNTALTVEAGKAGSHKHLGWNLVTAAIINCLSHQNKKIAFVLWGKHAQELKAVIRPDNFIIESSHPSSMGGSCNKGFFGSKPFSRVNAHLTSLDLSPIDWQL